MRRSHTLPLAAALGALSLAAAGCGGLADQLQAENVAIAALIKTPELENPQTHDKVPGIVTFQLFFGQIDKSKISLGTDGKQAAAAGAFTGLAGATVKLDFKDPTRGDTEVNVADKGEGKYLIDSPTANLLTYNQTDYTANISYGGKVFQLKVAAPLKTDVKEFLAATDGIIKDHDAGAPLTLTRAVAQGATKNPIAFVNLSTVTGAAKADTWNNLPKDAMGFLQLALDDSQWRQDAFTIPGNQFQARTGYLATLTAVERGEPVTGSPALFLGSSFLAGVAAGGGVITK